MSALSLDNQGRPSTANPLRVQRMTAEEAQAVIALWQSERFAQAGLIDHPAVLDVAEGLDVSPEEVLRLLAEVRVMQARAQADAQAVLAEEGRRAVEFQRRQAESEAADQRLGARAFGLILAVLTGLALLLWAFCLLCDGGFAPPI